MSQQINLTTVSEKSEKLINIQKINETNLTYFLNQK